MTLAVEGKVDLEDARERTEILREGVARRAASMCVPRFPPAPMMRTFLIGEDMSTVC